MSTVELEEQFVNLIKAFIISREGKGGIMLPNDAMIYGAFHNAMVTNGLYNPPMQHQIIGEKKYIPLK